MLEAIRAELNELTAVNMNKLSDPVVVNKSQELDNYVNEAMQRQLEAAKKENGIKKC